MKVQAISSRLIPGYGFGELHLGMSSSELAKCFGKPVRRRRASVLREYWVYSNFECIVSRKSHKVLSIFVQPVFAAKLGEDFSRWSEARAEEQYGVPSKKGGGFALGDKMINLWMIFDSGIGFEYEQNGNLASVKIFRRRRTATKKAAKPVEILAAAA